MFRHSLHPTPFGFALGLAVIALWALLWIWVVGQLAGAPRQPERRLPPMARFQFPTTRTTAVEPG
jgi:hypothetical protein